MKDSEAHVSEDACDKPVEMQQPEDDSLVVLDSPEKHVLAPESILLTPADETNSRPPSPDMLAESPPPSPESRTPLAPDTLVPPSGEPRTSPAKATSDNTVEELMLQLHGDTEELMTPGQEVGPKVIQPPTKSLPIEDETSPINVAKVSRRLAFATKSKARISKTRRAGLVLSVPKIHARLKRGRYSRRVGTTGSVYLAAVLEYLVAEVLELAGNCARYFKRKRVFPRCIQLTFLHDKELEQLTKGIIVPQGGVRPNILPELLGPKEERMASVQSSTIASARVLEIVRNY